MAWTPLDAESAAKFLMLIVKCIYLMLPGIAANTAPVLCKNILKPLAFPLDFNRRLWGNPIFGENKTFRGFAAGIAASAAVAYAQRYLYSNGFSSISLLDYSAINPLYAGFIVGFGVLFGDLAKSFVKRRLGLKPGAMFFPWDQVDGALGGLAFGSLVFLPPPEVAIAVIALALFMSVSFNYAAFRFGIKKVWW